MPSVRPGKPLKKPSIFKNIQTYINNKKYKFTLWSAGLVHNYLLKEKLSQIIVMILNIIITGALIYYILNNKNFISYGLIVIVGLYYFDVIVQIIKKPYNKK